MASFPNRSSSPLFALTAVMALVVPLLAGCEDQIEEKHINLKINGQKFRLELAVDNPTRIKGLGGRTEIAATGGMMFVFPDDQVAVQAFVMRDCTIPIDIIFLDKSGRVVASHEMKPEAPQAVGESEAAYENRLKRYSSRFPSQFVVELKGGVITGLKLREGQKIDFDPAALKARAK